MLESLGKPKRPLTGYVLFIKDRRARSISRGKIIKPAFHFHQHQPSTHSTVLYPTSICRMTASERQKTPTDVIKMFGEEWKGMSEAQKQPYLDKYEKLKVRWSTSKILGSSRTFFYLGHKHCCMIVSWRKYSSILNVQAQHDRAMEKWTEKMSREGKMAGILAAQARVADLRES